MTVSTLDASKLYFATLAGCQAIVRERATLNAINVFPVQDGDTGDNMTATASAVIHHAALKHSLKDTLQSVAHASLTGARGNSGMIFSQFFNALAEAVSEEDHVSPHRFSELLHHAATRVRGAILNPIDGTMLTILEHWSIYMKEHATQLSCFKTILQKITYQLQEVVAQTTQTLAVLKKANVVDAGALGFFHFVHGFSHFIANPTPLSLDTLTQAVPELPLEAHLEGHTPPDQGRYCTEACIRGEHLDQEQLMHLLKQHGDSIVLTGSAPLYRFHLHTSAPWAVFEALQPIGQIHQPKVDDMLRQYQSLHQRQHKVALVTDSSADVPPAFFDQHQIHLLPLHVQLNHHELLDKYSLAPHTFYQHFSTEKGAPPKTACPSPKFIEQKLKPLAARYDEVLVLSLAKALSGTHDVIKLAAQAYPNVHVLDTHHCSGAQGLLLQEAATLLAEHPDYSAAQVCDHLNTTIPATRCWFMVPSLDTLIHSGRVNKIIGKMAQFSGLKPIFSFSPEGKVTLFGKAFHATSALEKIIHAVQKHIKAGEVIKRYCIIHANVPAEAEAFAAMTTAAFRGAPAYIESASPVIGAHAGPGCVGMAVMFEPSERRP